MDFSPAFLSSVLARLPNAAAYRVAFSGGCDSTVLLHALSKLRGELETPVSAIHVDHGLNSRSADWSAQCESVCRTLAIECTVLRVDAHPDMGESREAAARRARYAALADKLKDGEAILTAHHQDDQSETFLLQLLRGTGPRGLAAMPEVSRFSRGLLLRPLLHCSRSALCRYAQEEGLAWVDDPSNFDTGFDRNFLRHRLVPLLTERWPAAPEVIARAARLQWEAAELLDELAALDFAATARKGPAVLDIAALCTLSRARQRNLVRYALRRKGLPVPSRAVLERVLTEVAGSRPDAEPLVHWPGGEARRYRGDLFLIPPLPPVPPSGTIKWDFSAPLVLPGGLGRIFASRGLGKGLRADSVEVTFRAGGETCRPAGRAHHHSLKKLLQESAVPPWERLRMPLLLVGGELAAVADRWVCEPFAAAQGETGWVVHWDRFTPETNE